jgi:hypothetical protein
VEKITDKGKVNKPKIGRKRAFNSPKTRADIPAFLILSISTPVGNLEIISKLMEVIIHATNKPIIFIKISP